MEKTRVNKGEKYWFINSFGEVVSKTESGVIDDAKRFEAGNYFHTKEEAEAMARKLRAVLNGADVIEMPSEEKIIAESKKYEYPPLFRAAMNWLKSKIVK